MPRRQPERVIPRIRAMLGEGRPFTLEWVSVYTFRCQRMERFRHGRVFFAGRRSASGFSVRRTRRQQRHPGRRQPRLEARARSRGQVATERLLDTYDAERVPAADENILNSTRSTDFITPKSKISRTFRDAALQLAQHLPVRARPGEQRTAVPAAHLSRIPARLARPRARSREGWRRARPRIDAPLTGRHGPAWLIDQLGEALRRHLLRREPVGLPKRCIDGLRSVPEPVEPLVIGGAGRSPQLASPEDIPAFDDAQGLFAQRYDATPDALYLIRPDQHLAARWRHLDLNAVRSRAVARGCLHLRPGQRA